MIGRRAAMRAVISLPFLAKAAEATLANQAEAFRIGTALPDTDDAFESSGPTPAGPFDQNLSEVIWALGDRRMRLRGPNNTVLPAKYQKRSWSPVMQAHYWAEDEVRFAAQMRALRKDTELAGKLANLLGISE